MRGPGVESWALHIGLAAQDGCVVHSVVGVRVLLGTDCAGGAPLYNPRRVVVVAARVVVVAVRGILLFLWC